MDHDQFRQLIEAADLGRLRSVLASDPDWANRSVEWFLNQKNESDPLHYVCDCVFNNLLSDSQASEIAALFLEHGALIEGSEGRESPLIAAASLGAEAVAKLLIESGANMEATAIFGARPLHWAASSGLPSTAKLLIQHGAKLEVKCSEFGATPLYWAVFAFGPHGPARKGDLVESARALIEAGACVDTSNNQGVSALECSLQAESKEMYELLFRYTGNNIGTI